MNLNFFTLQADEVISVIIITGQTKEKQIAVKIFLKLNNGEAFSATREQGWIFPWDGPANLDPFMKKNKSFLLMKANFRPLGNVNSSPPTQMPIQLLSFSRYNLYRIMGEDDYMSESWQVPLNANLWYKLGSTLKQKREMCFGTQRVQPLSTASLKCSYSLIQVRLFGSWVMDFFLVRLKPFATHPRSPNISSDIPDISSGFTSPWSE